TYGCGYPRSLSRSRRYGYAIARSCRTRCGSLHVEEARGCSARNRANDRYCAIAAYPEFWANAARGRSMIAASTPVERASNAKLLIVDECGQIEHRARSEFVSILRPGDVVIANDAATLPASLSG